jgi:hypothetical protein
MVARRQARPAMAEIRMPLHEVRFAGRQLSVGPWQRGWCHVRRRALPVSVVIGFLGGVSLPGSAG